VIFAEEAAEAIVGRPVRLGELPRAVDGWAHVRERIAAGQPVNVVAMKPYDRNLAEIFRRIEPRAVINVTAWDPERKSLVELEAQAKTIGWWRFRAKPAEEPPDLVVVAIPGNLNAPTYEQFYRSYAWVINWSMSAGRSWAMPRWDVLALLPSVATPAQSRAEETAEALAIDVVMGQDIPWLRRNAGDMRSPDELLEAKIRALLAR
jgi:hypothetical protein